MDRRSLLDGGATPTQERANVFSDEHEVEDWDGVADGFRPNVDRADDAHGSGYAGGRDDDASDVDDEPIRTVSAHYATHAPSPTMPAGPSRTSTRKSRSYANPFVSPEDDETPSHERSHSLQFEPESIIRRSVSSASSGQVYARTDSPRFGAGPSHPYAMYPQGTIARTASVATASTTRPTQRQSYSQNRPQHPYAMYPQGVDSDLVDLDDDDDEDVDQIRQNPVPVGFSGHGQNYTRRLGPDGEDQDIIGEDGYTEQLPPYSRYPEDGPEKVPLLPPALHSRAPVAGTDPGMPLMHTTLLPAQTPSRPQSMMDESTLARHASALSDLALIRTSSSAHTSTRGATKVWKDKTWKEKRKTKFCGIPFWWILLSAGVLAFIAAVLGGVIGGFVAGGKHAQKHESTISGVTPVDASLIPSPTSGAPPTGTFALTLGSPEETQAACLPDTAQQVAWDCNLAPNSALGLVVSNPTGSGMGASTFYASDDSQIAYGAQLPSMNTTFAQFLTVEDIDDPASGPAFYFQQFYDKVVVVPEDAFTASSKKKRGDSSYIEDFAVPTEWQFVKSVATPGAKPWFCVWNGTFLEGFIYVTESISTSASTATSMTNSSYAATTSSPLTSAPAATTPPSATTSTQAYITTTFMNGYTTATYTGPVAEYGSWLSDSYEEAKSYTPPGSGQNHRKRQISEEELWSQLQLFPYIVKLEERRLPNNPIQPYCQQYQILDSGQANWVADDDGNPIMVQLDEVDPSFAAYHSAGSNSRRHKRTVAGSCHCQWMSGENITSS